MQSVWTFISSVLRLLSRRINPRDANPDCTRSGHLHSRLLPEIASVSYKRRLRRRLSKFAEECAPIWPNNAHVEFVKKEEKHSRLSEPNYISCESQMVIEFVESSWGRWTCRLGGECSLHWCTNGI